MVLCEQFVFNIASVAGIIDNCQLMRVHAIHQWILFIALHGRQLMCDKL